MIGCDRLPERRWKERFYHVEAPSLFLTLKILASVNPIVLWIGPKNWGQSELNRVKGKGILFQYSLTP